MNLDVPDDWLNELVTVAWRLDRLAVRSEETQLRYLARRLTGLMNAADAVALDLTGEAFTEGLAVEVVDGHPVDGPGARLHIKEMLAPVVQVNGRVTQFGQVTLQPIDQKE